MPQPQIRILQDAQLLAEEAARRIIAVAQTQYSSSGQSFSLFLSGGSTPKVLYELLAADPNRAQLDWPRVQIYFSDERCVPPDHQDSNYLMAHTAMLSNLPIPPENIHRMRGEIDPQAAAIEYGRLLKANFGDGGPNIALLGMGTDGHTASLFPGSVALDEPKHRCVADFVPKLNSWRITLTYPFLNRSKSVLVLVAGAEKADVLKEALEGPSDPKRLPIQGIQPAGEMTWLIDAAAAVRLAPGLCR